MFEIEIGPNLYNKVPLTFFDSAFFKMVGQKLGKFFRCFFGRIGFPQSSFVCNNIPNHYNIELTKTGNMMYNWIVGWKLDSRLTSITLAVLHRTSEASIFFSRAAFCSPLEFRKSQNNFFSSLQFYKKTKKKSEWAR